MPSTSIKWYFYDHDHANLKISFIHGGVYQYSDVPPFAFEDLQRAQSKGRFFHEAIRGRYHYKKITKRSQAVLKHIGVTN